MMHTTAYNEDLTRALVLRGIHGFQAEEVRLMMTRAGVGNQELNSGRF